MVRELQAARLNKPRWLSGRSQSFTPTGGTSAARRAGLDPRPTFDRDELTELHAEWWPEFVRQAGHKLPASLIALGERFGPLATLFEQLWSTPPRTLTHSDLNVGNMFFASPEGGEPFTVIDWQSIGRRRGTWDVGTFLGQNLEPGVRSEIEIGLLNLDVQTLTDNGVQRYGLEQCLYDYKLCLLHRFGSLISTIAAMPFTPEQIQMHIDILLPRNVAALLDHDAAALLD